MKNNGFPKKNRLCGNKKIEELFGKGRSGFVYPFRYLYYGYQDGQTVAASSLEENGGQADLPDNLPQGGVEVLISVSKRYHKKANKRNLLKRRTKEAYRISNTVFRAGEMLKGKNMSLGLIYSTKEVLDYNTIKNAVGKIISEIAKSA